MSTTFTVHRQRAHDLTPAAADEVEATPPPEVKPCQHQSASVEELANLAGSVNPTRPWNRRRGARDLLPYLSTFPGQGWADRWLVFEREIPRPGWTAVVTSGGSQEQKDSVVAAAVALMTLDVIRPSYDWMNGSKVRYLGISTWRDPEGTEILRGKLASLGSATAYARVGMKLASQVQAHTGKSVREITAHDLLELRDSFDVGGWRGGGTVLWEAMHQLGWIEHPSTTLPSKRRRKGQLSSEELVDSYLEPGPHRDVLVQYLKHRSASLDYSSRTGLARNLVKNFWRDLVDHHPELATQPSFAITREQAEAWKQRVRVNEDGTPKLDPYPVLFVVRAFYLDIAQWALQDSYWAPWVAPTPIYAREMKGYSKQRRAVVARGHERTRQLAPLLPQLVARAEDDRRDAAAALATAAAAGDGATVTHQGHEWTVFHREPTTPIWLRRTDTSTGERIDLNLTKVETDTFWAWAIIETLRQTGIRQEELLELTHLAIQPYKTPSTGETIPLLHIVPSKTDQERLIVASPELVHVLAQIVARLREGGQKLPLTQRWDHQERAVSALLPHLFAVRRGRNIHVMSPNTVAKLIAGVARKVENAQTGEPVHFTPHDLRRIFATDALSSGLPPHIVQVLMGHKSIATTQGYAAIYPQDVIRHHRTFIAQRRKTRPTEEYREPTPDEWEEFEAHFVSRKVSLGSCGRAYGTSCHHEHACVRCALLRPDPAQLDRLLEITANLKDRIAEAKEQGWLGEVEGLQISLTGAQHKLAQMQQQMADPDEPVVLGLPRTRGERGGTR